jgi:hypothetical protein
MATGDQSDMLARLKAVLPTDWFPLSRSGQPSNTPVLDGLLSGPASAMSFIFSLIEYANDQTRIATATDVWLDLAALDYFGGNLTRNNGETDAAFSLRIRASLLPPAATRAAMVQVLTNLTGTPPKIFEPTYPMDTGAWGYGGLGYGMAGGYGSLVLPAQAFITAFRQVEGGIPNLPGYSGNLTTPVYAPGGYGTGLISYSSLAAAGTQIQDAEIYATVARTQAAGVTCWTRIENPPTGGGFSMDFSEDFS